MESFDQNNIKEHVSTEISPKVNIWKWITVGLLGLFLFSQVFNIDLSIRSSLNSDKDKQVLSENQDVPNLEEVVLPPKGVVLPVKWGDLGAKMVEAGVIDKEKMELIYEQRGGLGEEEARLLYGEDNANIRIDRENANFLLNLFWALGLANENSILEEGPMKDQKYGGDAGRFASTGGWTISKGSPMDHYSKHQFMMLTEEQQNLVGRVAKNIYRPCCGNSTYFPDCNHGMAMLGLLELMASQGVGEEKMYEVALQVNSYWFPSNYLTIAKYFEKREVNWTDVDPKEALGSAYSSGQGYSNILKEIVPQQAGGGNSCGV